MYSGNTVALLLPARDEAEALPAVLRSAPPWVDKIIVVDNGSTDATAQVARRCGADVTSEPVRGYGRACLAGLTALGAMRPEVVAFADSDGSDDLSRLAEMVGPVAAGDTDLMLARRRAAGPGALTFPQRFGNRLATGLIRLYWRHAYSDLGPMRAISWAALQRVAMDDCGCGWTVQMQIRALSRGLRVREIDLPYRPRIAGRSKISRTVGGSVRAGAKILAVIARESTRERAWAHVDAKTDSPR